jgi:glutamate/tyrosine decarboxylase-like PLP-dependent enzyme
MHVDGAYGAFFALTDRARAPLQAMALADSVVLDPHKGLFLPYGCGAVLVKEGDLLRRAFSFTLSYLSDVEHEEPSPSAYSPELTRHFRGLRLWMSLKVHGLERYRAALELLLARSLGSARAMPRSIRGRARASVSRSGCEGMRMSPHASCWTASSSEAAST